MSYGFDMGFAQANSLQEAMAIALEYTQSQMTEKNVKKSIRTICIIFHRFVPDTLLMKKAKHAGLMYLQTLPTGIGSKHCLLFAFCIGKNISCLVSS